MFTVKPLARNRPTPVPYPFEQITPSYRYITTLSTRYVVDDSQMFVIRMASAQEKVLVLPATPTSDRYFVIQDLGGATADTPFVVECGGSKAFIDGDVLKTYTEGNITIIIKYNGSTYDIVEARDMYQQSYVTMSMPNVLPIRDEDSVVEATDADMLIIMANPLGREVTFRKPSLVEGETTYSSQFFVVLDGVNTAGTYPIRLIFEGCTCNGNSSYTTTGNGLMLMLKTQTDGNYVLWEYSNAAFSDYTIAPNDKIFGFVSIDYPYYASQVRGFSSITPPTTGGKFLTLGV